MEVRELNADILCKSDIRIKSSLIICTYKRPETLLRQIKALAALDDLPEEVLIVDGSQNNESFTLIKEYVEMNPLVTNFIYIFGPTGLTIQRNAGIDIARGEILHFLDDDCIPEKGYFTAVETIFNTKHDVGGITGNILNESEVRPGIKYKIRLFLGIYKKKYMPGMYYCNGSSVPKGVRGKQLEDVEVDAVSGASMSFKKEILNKAGDFCEFFSGYSQGEDLEVSLRVRRLSKIIQSYDAKCNHYQEAASRPDLYKKGFMEIYNRYYIWHFNVNSKTIKCKMQFWGDVIFLHIFAVILWIRSGFELKYILYFKGYFKGSLKSINARFVEESKRTLSYKIKLNV